MSVLCPVIYPSKIWQSAGAKNQTSVCLHLCELLFFVFLQIIQPHLNFQKLTSSLVITQCLSTYSHSLEFQEFYDYDIADNVESHEESMQVLVCRKLQKTGRISGKEEKRSHRGH